MIRSQVKRVWLCLLTLTFTTLNLFGQQNPIGKNDLLLQGYGEKVKGTEFWYNSSIPDIHDAYLVRADEGNQTMVWRTEIVPDHRADTVVFVWLTGLGANLGNAKMHLAINNSSAGSFSTANLDSWDKSLDIGGSLSFRSTMRDAANDLFGFMFLRIPANQIPVGDALELSITGSASNSQAWCMTFLSKIPTGLTISTYPAMLTQNKKEQQPVNFQVVYFGQPTPASIYVDDREIQKTTLQFGIQNIQVGINPVKKEKNITIRLESEALAQEVIFTQKPIRKWEVGFVQHSHTDIGYTRPQHEILAEHLRFIDYALDYCDATDLYPDAAKFRWTCEAAFAVDDYLRSRPQNQIDRLMLRINEGRIEVSGMYFNFDEMPDEYTLAASLKPLARFKDAGIPVTAAMQDDVNGIAWCFADYFEPLGIKYLNMGTHGHRALIAFDKPTAFWWESPSGRRILTFRAEHYMTANTFGIHGNDFDYFENKLMTYLVDLEQKGYPYNKIHIQHSGYQTDNSPPSTKASELVKQWNSKYDWPKIKTATVSEFFHDLEKVVGDDLPVYRAAWPDWWTDGFASGAREAATSRETHEDILAFEGALAMARILGASTPSGIHNRIEEVQQSLLFYDEHTFGHAQSVREPLGEGTMEQRELKESYAWEAYRRSRRVGEEAMGLLQGFITKEEVSTIAVFNTLNYKRSALLELYIDHQILPMGIEFKLIDEEGNIHPAQATNHRSDGTYWSIWVKDIQGFSMKKLKIVTTGLDEHIPGDQMKHPAPTIQFENQFYRAVIDKSSASLISLVDLDQNSELVDQSDSCGLGTYIYEQLSNREQMEAFTLNSYKRNLADSIRFENQENGPVWTAFRFKAESTASAGPAGLLIELRFYHEDKRVEFFYRIRKKSIFDPEAVYIAFPFHLPDGKLYFDVPGGTVQAGVDQIPGSTNDWNTVQNYVSLRNRNAQIVICSSEIPLMQLGGINTGRYEEGAEPEKTHVYGWPMNNYWTTNFNADQRGEFSFSYFITSLPDPDNKEASQFGWSSRIPLLGRTLPPGTKTKKENPVNWDSLIQGIPDHVQLISARILPHPNAILLHLREVNNQVGKLSISIPLRNNLILSETNVLGQEISQSDPNNIRALETKFIKIKWN